MKKVFGTVFAVCIAAVSCGAASGSPVIGIADICPGAARDVAVRSSYARAVYRVGGTPFVLPATTNAAEIARVLDRIDALLLSGGEDVAPVRYGAVPSPKLGAVNELRDAWEFALLDAAVKRGLPVVGICRGHQLINVYFGGTLRQDIPSECPDALRHKGARHEIAVEPDSRLAMLLGCTNITVNSSHHQAVKKLAPGFRITARSPDGIVEAIEGVAIPVAGVQFHPEALYNGGEEAFGALFSRIFDWAGAAVKGGGRL